MNNITSKLVFATLLGCVLIVAFGLMNFQWPEVLPWAGKSAILRYLLFVAIIFSSVLIISITKNINPLLSAIIVAFVLLMITNAIWALFVTLLIAFSSLVVGMYVGELIGIRFDRINKINSLLIGMGIYGSVVGLLAHIQVNYYAVYIIGLLLPVMIGKRLAINEFIIIYRFIRNNFNETSHKVDLINVSIATVAIVYISVALMPELGYDALASHLFVPAQLSIQHIWPFDVKTYVWAVMPMLGDWIFAIGYMLAGESSSRLINVSFIFVLAWLIREIILWANGSINGAKWAVLLFLTMPLTFTEGSSLFIESIWTSFIVAGIIVVFRSLIDDGQHKGEVLFAGLLLGFAVSAKAISFALLPALLLLMLWKYKFFLERKSLRYLIGGLILFVIIGVIPYATAWYLTGNPVFPMFNQIFQSEYFPSDQNFNNPRFNEGVTWDILYRMTFESSIYLEATAGAIGFQWMLIMIPASIVLIATKNKKAIILLAFGIATIALVFQMQSYLRYVFPSWVLLTASIGVAISLVDVMPSYSKYLWRGVLIIAVILNVIFLSAASFYRDFPLVSILDEQNKSNYLVKRLPIRDAVKLVNHLNTEGSPVAVFGEPSTAGLAADALYANWYNYNFYNQIASIHTEKDLVNILLGRGVNYVILDSSWRADGSVSTIKLTEYLEIISVKIASYDSVTVRMVKQEYRYGLELLKNPDFQSIDGWSLSSGTVYNSQTSIVLANVYSPATQSIEVEPGQHYLNTVVARCAHEKTLGRVQINWVVKNGENVGASAITFECTPSWSEYKMEVVAPSNAINAIVYTGGHTEIPLEFKSNSLRQ